MKAVTWSGFCCCGYTCLIESYNISKPKAPEESKNCEPSIAPTSDMKLFDGLVTFPVTQVLATDTCMCICAILRVWLNRKRFTNGGEKIIKHNHKDSIPNKCRGNSRAMLMSCRERQHLFIKGKTICFSHLIINSWLLIFIFVWISVELFWFNQFLFIFTGYWWHIFTH